MLLADIQDLVRIKAFVFVDDKAGKVPFSVSQGTAAVDIDVAAAVFIFLYIYRVILEVAAPSAGEFVSGDECGRTQGLGIIANGIQAIGVFAPDHILQVMDIGIGRMEFCPSVTVVGEDADMG